MRFTEISDRTLSRLGIFFEFAWWLVVGVPAMLWWLPEQLGERHVFPPWQGALYLAAMWVWVFNHWPSLGTRRFFREEPFLRLKIALLLIITAVSSYGFISAA
jgi:hypothetical protein